MSTASEPKNPRARTFFQYGNDAAQKANFDYAIQMYQEACKVEPTWLLARQHLRVTARRKFGNDPSKVGRMVSARTQTIKLKARAAKAKGNWAYVIEVCEEVFVVNPWDLSAAREAAEAAEHLGYKELAQWFMESVLSVAGNDADYYRHAAHVFEINASWPKAIAAWEQVKRIHPYDEDAGRQINALSASATIQRAGLGESIHKHQDNQGGSGPDRARDVELNELKQPQFTPEERWQKEIQDDPTMVGPYLQYAEHLKMRSQLDDAEKLLAKGIKAVPDDPSLQLAYAEVQIARLNRAIASWGRKVREVPGDAASKAKLDQLNTMLADYEIKEYRRRIKLNPADPALQFELGTRLAKAGQHRDAIAAFQQARSSPAHRVEALHQAGQSFESEGQLKLAERSYQDALKALEAGDTPKFNALHYRLGRVAEAMGNAAAAEEHYNEVAANDYGYLDVAQRLRGLG